jgi:hypothetical protein
MTDYIIFLVSAVAFAMRPFTRRSPRETWARVTFFAIAVLFLILGVCGLLIRLNYWSLSRPEFSEFRYASQAVLGFIMGCCFTLLVSGNLFGNRILPEKKLG